MFSLKKQKIFVALVTFQAMNALDGLEEEHTGYNVSENEKNRTKRIESRYSQEVRKPLEGYW